MNARLYLSFMLSIACIIATATPLSRQQALIRVQASLRNVQVADKTLSCQEIKADEPYYIFSGDNSFVIASGDDRFPAVLGYSNNSSLNRDDMPPALKHLLRACSTPTGVPASTSEPHASGSVSRKPILPLVRSTWGQEAHVSASRQHWHTDSYRQRCHGFGTSDAVPHMAIRNGL